MAERTLIAPDDNPEESGTALGQWCRRPRRLVAGEGTGTTKPQPSSAGMICVVALIAAAALVFGWPTRNGDFLNGDDQRLATEQVFVNHPSWRHAGGLLTTVHGDLYQPVPMLTFQANYALAAREPGLRFAVSPYGFHLTNIILHVINAVLVCLIAHRLSDRRGVALLVGLLFAGHPLALEPVAWVSGRMILLATLFALVLMLACLTRRADGGGAWWWVGGIAWLLALLSKVLPTVPIAAAWCDHHRHGRLPRRTWLTYAVFVVMTVAATWLATALTARFGMIEQTQAESTTSAPVRVLLAGRHYLESYVWPSRLAAWTPPPDNVAFFSVETGLALLEWAVFGVLLWMARRRSRLAFLGLGLFVVLIAPFLAATLVRRLLVADRYMYLPIIGLHLAFAAEVVRILRGMRARLGATTAAVIAGLPLAAVLGAWLVIAWQYAPCWADSAARDRRIVAVYPDRVEARVELAKAHVFQNEPDGALAVIAHARRHWPDDARLASEAGEAYRLEHDWTNAAAELAIAAERMPNRSRTQYYLALTLEELGRTDEARTIYRRLLDRDAMFMPAATALARSFRAAGETDAAIDAFERVVRDYPYLRDSRFELALLYISRGDWPRARTLLEAILGIDADDGPALLNLGAVLAHLGQTEHALAVYDRLLRVDPNASAARVNRANLLASLGKTSEAEAEYRAVLDRQPDDLSAAIGLHELLQEPRRYGELVALWTAFPNDRTETASTRAWLAWAYVLDGKADAARAAIADLPGASPTRAFADLALAYAALRAGDDATLRRQLAPPLKVGEVPPAQREQARIVLTALAALPTDVRDSPAGLYTLARALIFAGDINTARSVTGRLRMLPGADSWSEETAELSRLLAERPPTTERSD